MLKIAPRCTSVNFFAYFVKFHTYIFFKNKLQKGIKLHKDDMINNVMSSNLCEFPHFSGAS